MYLLLLFFPLLSFGLSGCLGKYFGFLGIIKITAYCIGFCLTIILFLLFEIITFKSPVFITMFYWINCEIINIYWTFVFDYLTIIMCLIIIIVSFLVHLYSIEYMYFDPFLSKFISYLSLFTFFMLILVTSDNLIQMFIGWEGVGLCSYLLINFWYTRIQANKAAIKAMILNRIGDIGLLFSILFLYINFKTFDYYSLILLVPLLKTKILIFNINLINLICFCLFIGAIGKSAQLGLHTWLPDAMEGPTPVSALIHAATMVTAGIFLIIRLSYLFQNSFNIYQVLIIVGGLTSFISGIIGLFQNDMKKIVAYSTCSQLGYMIISCGLNDYFISLFHLTNHAFFKALLFLSSGSVIHSINDEQDIRKMGGLKILLPFTYITTIIGSFALTGFPFLTGFYSKDFILESAVVKYNLFGYFCFLIGTIVAFITSFYSFRSIYLVFLSKPNGYKIIINFSIDSQFIIKLVLLVLVIPSIFVGYYSKDLLIGFGNNFFSNTIFISIYLYNLLDIELIQLIYKLLPINFSLLGIFLAFYGYYYYSILLFKIKTANYIVKLYCFFNRKWFFDKLNNEIFGQFFLKLGYSVSYKIIDRGIFEYLGPTGLTIISLNFSLLFSKFQTNNLYHIVLTILIAILFIIIQIYYYTILNINNLSLTLIIFLVYNI